MGRRAGFHVGQFVERDENARFPQIGQQFFLQPPRAFGGTEAHSERIGREIVGRRNEIRAYRQRKAIVGKVPQCFCQAAQSDVRPDADRIQYKIDIH